MKSDGETMDQRRAHLAAQIERQRGELAGAYRNLAKPIHYTETAMRGFGFLRQNPWVISVVPAVVSLGSALVGLRKGKSEKLSRSRREELERLDRKPRTVAGHVAKWGGRGWKLFKIYRRVRHFFL
jgi:hypothetical protein